MKKFLLWVAIGVSICALNGFAETELDSVLSDSDPTGIPPSPLTTDDFEIKWKGASMSNVSVALVPGSLQWVRVNEVLMVPRALVKIQALQSDHGFLRVRGIHQSLSASGQAALLVPLIAGSSSQIQLDLIRETSQLKGSLEVHFKPREKGKQVFVDTSCSRTSLKTYVQDVPNDIWVYLGCRAIRTGVETHARNDLEVSIFSSEEELFSYDLQKIESFEPHHWNFRFTTSNDTVDLLIKNGKLKLTASIPEKSHLANIGFGLGPYKFDFEKEGDFFHSTVPLATFYGSLTLHGTNRVVVFGAFTANKNMYSDAGSYFQFESFRGFDRRISLQLLIGVHGFSYSSANVKIQRFNYPQGFEFIVYDLLGRGNNASLGGFLQPSINNKEYYNTWIRWGPQSWFVEANYIYTAESPGFSVRTYGITAGVPLIGFL